MLAAGAKVLKAAVARSRGSRRALRSPEAPSCGRVCGAAVAAAELEPPGGGGALKLPTLMLVDGHACLYQSYFGTVSVGMRNRAGEPIGAVDGFLRRLRRLQRELRPSHLAVMMDEVQAENVKKNLWRHKLFPEYKAKRKGPPEELRPQLAKAREACEAFQIRWFAEPGYEADDLIYTYATEVSEVADVHIISTDKDLAQLVGPRVFLHCNMKNLADRMDVSGVTARWHVKPEQLGDLLALTGDTADSIPGIPGIGPQKAAALLERHETLDDVLAAAESGGVYVPGIGPKLLANLRMYANRAREMRKVVKLRTAPGLDPAGFESDLRAAVLDKKWLDQAVEFLGQENMERLLQEVLSDTDEFAGKEVG